MASVKRQQINQNMKAIIFDTDGHEISFGLVADDDDLKVCEIKFIKNNLIAKETTLSKKWVAENILPAIFLLKDNGVLQMKTPLGYQFVFTKDNLKALGDFINL